MAQQNINSMFPLARDDKIRLNWMNTMLVYETLRKFKTASGQEMEFSH